MFKSKKRYLVEVEYDDCKKSTVYDTEKEAYDSCPEYIIDPNVKEFTIYRTKNDLFNTKNKAKVLLHHDRIVEADEELKKFYRDYFNRHKVV